MTFRIKRVCEPSSPQDGIRVLVDRLWPRGLKKTDAYLGKGQLVTVLYGAHDPQINHAVVLMSALRGRRAT
jgi:uncharacterized protein YeaO (DUF488 family)